MLPTRLQLPTGLSLTRARGAGGGADGPASGDGLLLESGDFILLETGDFLMLE